jgi:hypothetical protein
MIDHLRESDWTPLTEQAIAAIPATVGVFEVADAGGTVVDIGYAGGHAPFGLRTVLQPWLEQPGQWQFAYEVTTSYLTRFREIALTYRARYGALPDALTARGEDVSGRLQP